MVVIICCKYGNDRFITENVTERTRLSKSRSNDLQDIGQGERSSHATHLIMLVIICTKYGKNPSRTVDATARTRFSRPRPNDIWKESIENWRIFPGPGRKISKICQKFKFSDFEKNVTCDTPSNDSDHLCQIWEESIQICRRYRADTIFKAEWPWRYKSRSKVIVCDTPSYGSDHLWLIWKESIQNCRCHREVTIFKAKAKWPWRYRSRSKVMICNTPSHTSDHLCEIWKESIENCRFFFQGQGRKFSKICQKFRRYRADTIF